MKQIFRNKMVLITGASSGIGRSMARRMAMEGANLILVARRKELLEKVAEEVAGVQDSFCTSTTIIPMDLTEEGAPEKLYEALLRTKVDVLINAAGFGQLRASFDLPLAKEMEMLKLNCEVLHKLTRLFLKPMMQRNEGLILNVASSAGLLPGGPYLAGYYATKAYVASYSRGLNAELKASGSRVRVKILCPGPVNTDFTKVAGGSEWGKGMTPDRCAKIAIDGVKTFRQTIIPGFGVKAGIFATRFLPKCTTTWIVGRYQKGKIQE